MVSAEEWQQRIDAGGVPREELQGHIDSGLLGREKTRICQKELDRLDQETEDVRLAKVDERAESKHEESMRFNWWQIVLGLVGLALVVLIFWADRLKP